MNPETPPTFRLEVVYKLLQCAPNLPNLVFPGCPHCDRHMKGLQCAMMVAEDGPGKHCTYSAPSEEKKALYWKGNDPTGSLFFKPTCQQFSRPMNQISSSDLCLTVAVACKVINHRYCAAVDPYANAHCDFPPQKKPPA